MRFTQLLGAIFGSSSSSQGGASFTNGAYYYAITASATPPALLIANWTLTTKADDVGVNDHTTYESTATANYVHVMRWYSASRTWQSWTASTYHGAGEGAFLSCNVSDGANWSAFGTPAQPAIPGWLDSSSNPVDAAGVACCVTAQDSSESRVGDFRPVSV